MDWCRTLACFAYTIYGGRYYGEKKPGGIQEKTKTITRSLHPSLDIKNVLDQNKVSSQMQEASQLTAILCFALGNSPCISSEASHNSLGYRVTSVLGHRDSETHVGKVVCPRIHHQFIPTHAEIDAPSVICIRCPLRKKQNKAKKPHVYISLYLWLQWL